MSIDKENYGPLSFLIGSWVGGSGEDRAPAPDRGVELNKFREEMHFAPVAVVKNHEQILYPLRYKTTAWEKGSSEPFHEEVGYWIWDGANQQVMRCFIVPRGVNVIAGGTVASDAESFTLAAEVGCETYGICSNKFLDEEFKTIRYDLKVAQIDKNTFSYEEDTQIRIKGKEDIFHHTDKNTMSRSEQ